MKRIFFILLLSGILGACAHIPDQDVVIKAYSPAGPAVLFMKKGTLDKENHGKDWIYKYEFDKRLKGE